MNESDNIPINEFFKETPENNIATLAYALYKIDWMERMSPERQLDAMREWYTTTDPENRDDYPFEEWLDDNGYSGELYVCFGEFLGAEFLDKEYMKYLLKENDLIEEYNKALKSA